MATRITALILTAPAALFVALLAIPGLDRSWGTNSFHFWIVSAACMGAAAICALLIVSARSIRETRILFLALCFFSLGMIFGVHGLTTPGHIYELPSAALQRSPWISTLAAGFFAAMSVVSLPTMSERVRLKLPHIVFGASFAAVYAYFIVSLAAPNWLADFPTQREWFQHTLTGAAVALLCFAAWRYYQSYRFTRLPSQLAVVTGMVFLAEAQVSIDFGNFWHYSWWMYHALFLAAFVAVLTGWGYEFYRARNVSAIAEAIAMRDALAQFNRGRANAVITLADRIENHDLETFRHVDRVAAFAYAIGQRLGFGPARLRDLVLAAQMHDIGKIGLPKHILQKPGPLNDDEWARIKQHPTHGMEIVSRVKGIGHLATVIRHHHERFDGNGYPDGVAGEQIPLEARIISVADTFDALTSERPYRAAMTIDEAKAELKNVAGTQLDPECVETLLSLLDEGKLNLKRHREAEGQEHEHSHALV